MKKLNQLSNVAVLVVGVLLPMSSFAEYAVSTPSFEFDGSRASEILAPLNTAGRKAAPGSVEEELAQLEADLDKKLGTSQEEAAKRKRIAELRKQIDQSKATVNFVDLTRLNDIKKEQKKSLDLQNMFSSLLPNQTAAIDPNALDRSGQEAVCSRNVEGPLQKVRQMSELMNSQAMNGVKSGALKELADHKKKVDEAKFEALLAGLDKQLADQKKKRAAEARGTDEFQANIAEGQLDPRSEEERLAAADAEIAEKNKGVDVWAEKTVAAIKTLLNARKELKDGEEPTKVAALGQQAMKDFETIRLEAYNSAIQAADADYKACKKQADLAGVKEPSAPGKLINAAIQVVTGFNPQYAQTFMSGLQNEMADLECRKIRTQVDAALGSTFQSQIAQLGNARDFQTLFTGVSSLMPLMQTKFQEVGNAFASTKNDCNRIAKFNEKLKNFTGNITQQMSQMQVPGVNNAQRRGTAGRQPVAGTNHIAQ